jgi:hypothetical protein
MNARTLIDEGSTLGIETAGREGDGIDRGELDEAADQCQLPDGARVDLSHETEVGPFPVAAHVPFGGLRLERPALALCTRARPGLSY